MLLVAKGIKAHGIRGDIKVDCLMDTPNLLCAIKEVTVNGNSFKVENARPFGANALLKLVGVNTMEQAETFRNVEIYASRDTLPEPPENRYYIDDIIGSSVSIDGAVKGRLTDILQNGSADVYVVLMGKEEVMFPCISGVIDKVDIDNKIIYINKEEFEKVAVYED